MQSPARENLEIFQCVGSSRAARSMNRKPIPPFVAKRTRLDRVRIGSTTNCGEGVFSLALIKGGQAIGRVFGDVKPSNYRSDYCVEFGNKVLEPFAPYRFLNHSCEPNCQFIEWRIEDGLSELSVPIVELWVHALRDIQPDEELTIDYGWDWKSAIPCKCGAPNCRGWICKEEDLDICRNFYAGENELTSCSFGK